MQNHHNVVIVVTDENSSFFNNDLMHNSTEKNTNYNYFISLLIEVIANQLMLLLHQLLHQIKTVQTILNEDQHFETASPSDSESMALAVSAPSRLQCSQCIV